MAGQGVAVSCLAKVGAVVIGVGITIPLVLLLLDLWGHVFSFIQGKHP